MAAGGALILAEQASDLPEKDMTERTSNETWNPEDARAPAGGVGAAAALFAALADTKTADFMRSVFSLPEQRPEVKTEKSEFRLGDERLWQVAVIEKPRADGPGKPLLNIALIVIDAGDGRVRERWFLRKIQDEEYRDFLRARFPPRAGCKGRTR
jgi:hypothetical protein